MNDIPENAESIRLVKYDYYRTADVNAGDLYVDAIYFFIMKAFKIETRDDPMVKDLIIHLTNDWPPPDAYTIASQEKIVSLKDLSRLIKAEHISFSAKKQISPDMAIEISINVEEMQTGAQLLADALIANSIDAPKADWQKARWSTGLQKEGFELLSQYMHHLRYDEIYYERD
jgi:hypothetical protein